MFDDVWMNVKEFLHICRNMTDEQVDAVLQKFGKRKDGQVVTSSNKY